MSASHVEGGRRLGKMMKVTACGPSFSLNSLCFFSLLVLNCVILLPQISELSKQAYHRRDRGYVFVSPSAGTVIVDFRSVMLRVTTGMISVSSLSIDYTSAPSAI
jgi:hypothetical protein